MAFTELDCQHTLVKLQLISMQMLLVSQLGSKFELTEDNAILYDECGPDLIKHLQQLHLDIPIDHGENGEVTETVAQFH